MRRPSMTFLLAAGLVLAALPAMALSPPMAAYVVTSETGYRMDPMGGGEESLHRGLDMVGPHGAAILAAGDGVVMEHWLPPGTVGGDGRVYKGHPTFGAMIVIDHGNGVWTLYGHMSRTFVHEGQRVTKGQVIGTQGATGDATGEHLHFEVIVDPRRMFDGVVGPSWRQRKELTR